MVPLLTSLNNHAFSTAMNTRTSPCVLGIFKMLREAKFDFDVEF